jgi:hypothetical protein
MVYLIKNLASIGIVLHLPLFLLAMFVISHLLPKQDGRHLAWHASLSLDMGLMICFAIAVLGFAFTLAATIWAQVQDAPKTRDLSWIPWGFGAVLLFWAGAVALYFQCYATSGQHHPG